MDRPDEVFCFSCRAPIGWDVRDAYVWQCPKCNVYTQVDGRGRSHQASPGIFTMIEALEKAEKDHETALRPYLMMVRIKGGRLRYVPPTSMEIILGNGFVAVVLMVTGLVLLYNRYFLAGLLFAGAAYPVLRWIEKPRLGKIAPYELMQKNWAAEHDAMKARLLEASRKPPVKVP